MKHTAKPLTYQKYILIASLAFLPSVVSQAHAETFVIPDNGVAEYSVQLSAQVQISPPQITIDWPLENDVLSYSIYRRTAPDTSWGQPLAILSSTTLNYTDMNVTVGLNYEYEVIKKDTTTTAYGYIESGIEIPLVDNRGGIVLVVDSSLLPSLNDGISQLESDLTGDGWSVFRHDVSSTTSVASVKSLIVSDYLSNPNEIKGVFLFGHIPVPYSGDIAPDGHADHNGAWPADAYYGDMTGNWTDTTVNDTNASDPRNWNIPGDGKFDQDFIPDQEQLFVGRVDLHNMPSFAPETETNLLQNYITKDHAYRFGMISPQKFGLISDNFGVYDQEAFAQSGWKNFSVLLGGNNIISSSTGYFNYLASSSYLWTYACGGGTYTSADGIGTTANFASSTNQGVFNMLFGSYFGDWDTTDNFLRAPLAATGQGLTDVWSGRPLWSFFEMGMGNPIGTSVLTTQTDRTLEPSMGSSLVHIALMGDPTLRLNVVPPPSGLTIATSSNTAVLNWLPSADQNVLGYYVYRSTNQFGAYVRATSTLLTGQSYTDNQASGSYSYMVRAVKLETTPSGSYYNASQGIFATTTILTASSTPPQGLTGQALSDSSISLSWSSGIMSNLAWYDVYRNGIQIATTSNLQYTDSGLADGTSYLYAVASADIYGDTSDQSSVSISTNQTPPPPQPVVSAGGGGGGGGWSFISIPTFIATTSATSTKKIIIQNCLPGSCAPTGTSTADQNTFMHDLYFGSTGPEVEMLQIYLNTHGFIVSSSGAGSPGQETATFGAKTRTALVKFQKANYIFPSLGYFGPLTRAFIKTKT